MQYLHEDYNVKICISSFYQTDCRQNKKQRLKMASPMFSELTFNSYAQDQILENRESHAGT